MLNMIANHKHGPVANVSFLLIKERTIMYAHAHTHTSRYELQATRNQIPVLEITIVKVLTVGNLTPYQYLYINNI